MVPQHDWLLSRGLSGKKDAMPVACTTPAVCKYSLSWGSLGFDRREDDKGCVISVRNRNNANNSPPLGAPKICVGYVYGGRPIARGHEREDIAVYTFVVGKRLRD